MKKISIALLLSLVYVFPAGAYKVSSNHVRKDRKIIKEIRITCSEGERDDCLFLCGSPSACIREEPYCLNCAGTTSPLLRQLFTQISTFYVPTDKVLKRQDMFYYFHREQYVLLNSESVFNYYKSPEGIKFKLELEKFCPFKVEQPLLVIRLNEEHQPEQLSFILCQEDNERSLALEVNLRHPELGPKNLSVNLFFY